MSNHLKGKIFMGFDVLPLKIFLEYWHYLLTTQCMVPPGLKLLRKFCLYILSFSDA